MAARVKFHWKSSQKNVTFYFSDFSYTAPAFMSYEYQLEGEDTGWMALTGRSDITYYDLPSGNYTFKVSGWGIQSQKLS